MKKSNSFKLRTIVSALVLVGLSACSGSSDSPEEGGGIIIGTGKTLEGTSTSNRLFASTDVDVRSNTGELFTGTVNDQGRFSIEDITGSGPWLVRRSLGNDTFLYGIVTETSDDTVVQNIHSYSDAVVRNWFATRGLDLDATFASTDENMSLPTAAEINVIYDSLTAVLTDVIANYNLSGVDLNTVEFAANGTGVDEFILENPIIQNDDTLTVVIFDPDNDTASVAVNELDLSTDLAANDIAPPSAPTSLRALPSASDEITLVWEVASDNIGIARYAIFRDGEEVATSPYPVFVDGGLASGSTFSYTVFAIDAAGNTSSSSQVASAIPLGTVDTTPPPTPSRVTIDTRRGSLDLDWLQDDIGDVASFAINRGTDTITLPLYLNVNSTFLFDASVNAGVEYCYTISAVDASGNESAPTGVSCATAPGAVVTTGMTTTPPVGPPVVDMPTGDALTAPQVDVSNVACTEEIGLVTVTEDTTVSAGCYLATRTIQVREPANLTLEPGVIIKFSTNIDLDIRTGASITAVGTETSPIILTGTEATAGHWDGVRIASSSVRNVLEYVQIEYAGNATTDNGALDLDVFGGEHRVAMSNSTLRFNAGPGLEMGDNIPLSTFDGNRYTGNAYPVLAANTSANLLDTRSSYVGNTLDAIVLDRTRLEMDVTWSNLDVPYHADRIIVEEDAVFTVEPGTTILFGDDSSITVQQDGTLNLIGTADARITLAGIDAEPGSWNGVRLSFAEEVSEMRFVNLMHAGGDDDEPAIEMTSNTSNPSRLAMSNVAITQSSGLGISTQFGSTVTEFTDMTITGNGGLAEVDMRMAEFLFNQPGNFTGNTVDIIDVLTATISEQDLTLSNATIPYHAGDISIRNVTFTLGAGVTMLMRANADISIRSDGDIVANGTAAAPVTIAGQQGEMGFWEGVTFGFATSSQSRLSFTTVADGGGGGANDAANIIMDCNSSNPSQLTIDNSQINNSLGFGISLDSAGCELNIDNATTFTNNALGDMSM